MSTPISQIRNNNNSINMQSMEIPQQMPIYNPNPPTNVNVNVNDLSYMSSQQNMAQTQSNLVDELLTELETQPEYYQDTNVAQTQYAMDNVNIPPTHNERAQQMLQSENSQSISSNKNSNNEIDEAYMFNNINLVQKNKNWIEKLIQELKPVLIVFVIFLILSMHQVNRIIFSFVPKLLLENGQLSLYAILLKSVLASILYYGLMKLI
jgi:hypothetical protein